MRQIDIKHAAFDHHSYIIISTPYVLMNKNNIFTAIKMCMWMILIVYINILCNIFRNKNYINFNNNNS